MSSEYCGGVCNYKQHTPEMRGSLLVSCVRFFIASFFWQFIRSLNHTVYVALLFFKVVNPHGEDSRLVLKCLSESELRL